MVLELSSIHSSEMQLSQQLAALGNALQLAMLRALLTEPATCMSLARRFDVLQPRAWQRLEALRRAGLVERQGHGAGAMYIAQAEEVRALFGGAMRYVGIAQEPRQNGETPELS